MFGSLTFGGYDDSRFIPNNVSLSLAPDITRDLVVGLKSITSTTLNSSKQQSLLPTPILTFIDSTLPFIYLPLEACEVFESTFGLMWNDTAETYWINETAHQNLLNMSPNITFTIGDSTAAGPTVDIVLPYASFDLEAYPPAVLNTTRYFPLQRADNETQYTLGRTFLQEAYVYCDLGACLRPKANEEFLAISSRTMSTPISRSRNANSRKTFHQTLLPSRQQILLLIAGLTKLSLVHVLGQQLSFY